jgi:hypothetical protein
MELGLQEGGKIGVFEWVISGDWEDTVLWRLWGWSVVEIVLSLRTSCWIKGEGSTMPRRSSGREHWSSWIEGIGEHFTACFWVVDAFQRETRFIGTVTLNATGFDPLGTDRYLSLNHASNGEENPIKATNVPEIHSTFFPTLWQHHISHQWRWVARDDWKYGDWRSRKSRQHALNWLVQTGLASHGIILQTASG